MPDVIDLAGAAVQQRDPETGLRSVAALRDATESLEAAHVSLALRAGWSWSRIARSLGVSKQAAHKKHARRPRKSLSEVEVHQLAVAPPARRAVFLARHEADSYRAGAVGTEHLLLGILRLGEGPAAEALGSLDLALAGVRAQVVEFADAPPVEEEPRKTSRRRRRAGRRRAARLPLSRRAREALEQAMREVVRLGDRKLGSEHLLLALLRDESAGALRVLAGLGVSAGAVERALEASLGPTSSAAV
jgi:ATP-dependent Clp protease ATP-binding subunit ClpA